MRNNFSKLHSHDAEVNDIISSVRTLFEDHCENQFNTLNRLSECISVSELEDVKDSYQALDFDDVFGDLSSEYEEICELDNQVIQGLDEYRRKKKLEEEAAVAAGAEEIDIFYQNLANQFKQDTAKFRERVERSGLYALLILSGIAITLGTFGHGANVGGALILEGANSLHELIGNPAVRDIDSQALLESMQQKQSCANEEMVDNWITQSQEYFDRQISTLDHILVDCKEHASTIHYGKIHTLKNLYVENRKAIINIKDQPNLPSRAEKVREIVRQTIHHEETCAPVIKNLKKHSPAHVETWIDQAKSFYHKNMKIIKFMGLVGLAGIGIGLTVASGGIVAGAIGAAALSLVGMSSAKHFIGQTVSQDALYKGKDVNFQEIIKERKQQIINHCLAQKNTVETIKQQADNASDSHFSHVVNEASEDYTESARKCGEVRETTPPNQAIKRLNKMSDIAEKTDRSVCRSFSSLKNQSKEQASLMKGFRDRSEKFIGNNKKSIENISKLVIATAALTTLGVATGGLGFLAATGFAVLAWGVSALAKKAVNHLKRINKDDVEREGEGEKVSEKESDSRGLSLH